MRRPARREIYEVSVGAVDDPTFYAVTTK